ncbi:MAG: hypothetical protein V3R58_05825, partial [candidate division NC10 bacterium]
GFVLATTGEELIPLSTGNLAARISERLGPEARLRFYGPGMHTALHTLPRELAHLVGQKPEWG